jgi:8-oxo-dGTP diphosphatase
MTQQTHITAHLDTAWAHDVVSGDASQSWHLMPPEHYLTEPLAIPHFQDRLRPYLSVTA